MGCTMGKTAAVPTKKSDITSNGYHGRQVSFSQSEKPVQNGNISTNKNKAHSDSESDSESESSNHKQGEQLSE